MKASSVAIADVVPIVVTRVICPANKGFEFPRNTTVYTPSHGRPSDYHPMNDDKHVDTDAISFSNSDAWTEGDFRSGIEMAGDSTFSG